MKTDGLVGNKIEDQPGEWLAWQLASARKASATDADEADAQAAAQAQAQAAAQPQSPYAQSYNRYGGSGSGYSSNRGYSAPQQSYTPSNNGGSSAPAPAPIQRPNGGVLGGFDVAHDGSECSKVACSILGN